MLSYVRYTRKSQMISTQHTTSHNAMLPNHIHSVHTTYYRLNSMVACFYKQKSKFKKINYENSPHLMFKKHVWIYNTNLKTDRQKTFINPLKYIWIAVLLSSQFNIIFHLCCSEEIKSCTSGMGVHSVWIFIFEWKRKRNYIPNLDKNVWQTLSKRPARVDG